ncbi:chalcone synthase B-like [Rhodamnia argentea]|uniref:Chalcone synthase B-like n=1 Tax=Rhodamnia argentea TaxID=178133 RepID=A0A8B8N4V2_9MYRT|nr:chalcone synthase B-like [Rhodamnia argentea]
MHPKLGFEAAIKAIAEWVQPKSAISHLIFCSMSGVGMPGADVILVKLLELSASINRLMLYNLSCYGSGTVLRIAKDIADTNPGARILAVRAESTCLSGRRQYREHGTTACLEQVVPTLVCSRLEACLVKAFGWATECGVASDRNSIFWVVHPGGWKVLDEVEETLFADE